MILNMSFQIEKLQKYKDFLSILKALLYLRKGYKCTYT